MARLVRDRLPTDDLVRIKKPVWVFGHDGRIREGDRVENAEPAWSYRQGISTLGKLLHAASPGSVVERECRVGRVERSSGAWRIRDESGQEKGEFAKVLVTAPAPQARELVAGSGAEISLAGIDYAPQFSFVLGFCREVEPRRSYHALLNEDRRHAIAWIGFEEDKAGHVPSGQTILVVQMSPDWTMRNMEVDRETLLPEVMRELRSVLPVPDPEWWDSQRWRYALPKKSWDASSLKPLEDDGLFFAGDGQAGKGRIALAIRSGIDVAERMLV
ncbi:NAD/FAD-dependent oxidoreductase [Haloferula helveola]|uniref:NAD/FAD-dependent oxidoreductase n=1 Tax=Haloferula helveola TaxID=490095 RepID=A0ABM7RFU2_9BACT|nr:NAD/FAD-dependent oxidoreductase [Haloferula helveola]